MLPLVSCICPTYGRCPSYQHLLEETIASFLAQDYPADRRELVILNDCPKQRLTFSPEITSRLGNVTIHQGHYPRFVSLGEKYNAAIALSKGQVILPFEDDDISLPNRISQAVKALDHPRWGLLDYFNPQRTWYLDSRGLHSGHTHGVCHNASAFSRSAWKAVGGYPAVSGAQDAIMDERLKCKATALPLTDDPATWSYIYRWSVSPCHLSGKAPHDEFYKEVGEWPVEEGTFELVPRFREDYYGMVREYLASLKGVAA